MTPEQYAVHAEQVLKISAHPLISGDDDDREQLAESCPSCGSILPTDTSAWDGGCPRCRMFVEVPR